jgi:hypothetical protein
MTPTHVHYPNDPDGYVRCLPAGNMHPAHECDLLPSTMIAFCHLCHVRIYWREARDSHEAAGHKVERLTEGR